MVRIYHIATDVDWARRTESGYEPSQFCDEGFVHCSEAGQLVAVANARFVGRVGLLLLTIDTDLLSADTVWEDLYGAGIDFPHVYGPIDLRAVVAVDPFAPDPDGLFDGWHPTA